MATQQKQYNARLIIRFQILCVGSSNNNNFTTQLVFMRVKRTSQNTRFGLQMCNTDSSLPQHHVYWQNMEEDRSAQHTKLQHEKQTTNQHLNGRRDPNAFKNNTES